MSIVFYDIGWPYIFV